jgi:hypothetical protein
MAGVDWYIGKPSGGSLWTEIDYRLFNAYNIESGAQDPELRNKLVWDGLPANDFLNSPVTRSRSLRLGTPLPYASTDLITYDNGQVQIYHHPSKTSYKH